jgi:tetratricopeptide (TPR) repeat protein
VVTYWRQGRSLPYGEGVSYWALAEMVKAHAGILETDSADEAEAKLNRALDGLIEEDVEWVRSHLRPLLGQATELAGGSREEAFAAWRRFFEALAEQRPLVLVFEDIQWADDGLLDFIEHLADWVRDVPLLILCTARLELLERRPAWGGGKVNAATIALAPLTDEETAKLIAGLSERPLLPAETQAALLDRAGGNPLYAEQYVRMLAERESVEELPLPESVQGIIAARLDGLPQEEKALLQDAAVLGKVFWLGALSATEQQLHALQQKEFVQRARRSSVEGEVEFSFKHLLVRDVAYGQIPRAARADKHLSAAEWIESLGRPEDHAEMVAHHYANAVELARAAGRDVGELAPRARVALREAGDRAATLNAYAQAEHYYAQALTLDPEGQERLDLLFRKGRVLYRAQFMGGAELEEARAGFLAAGDPETAAEAALMLADIAWFSGDRTRVNEHLEDAQALVAGRPPSRVHASVLSEVSRYEMLGARNESAIEIGRQALAMAEQLGLDQIRAHALNNVGSSRVAAGDPAGLEDIRESIAIATRLNSVTDMIRGHNNLAIMGLLTGRSDLHAAGAVESHRLAQHFGHYGFARWAEGGPLAGDAFIAGRWDEVIQRTDAFLADVGGAQYQASTSYACRGFVRLARGDVEGARSDAERAVESARPAGDPQVIFSNVGIAAQVFLLAGDEERASRLLGEILDGYRGVRQIGFSAVWAHTVAWVAQSVGRGEEFLELVRNEPGDTPWIRAARAIASRDFVAAADIFGEMGIRTFEAFYRLRAAEAFAAEGRRAEADEQLRQALAFYSSVGATRYVREGEALLAASA